MNCFTELGLAGASSKEEVVAAWRKLAMVHHPDRGGDHDTFVRLKRAYEESLKLADCSETLVRVNTKYGFAFRYDNPAWKKRWETTATKDCTACHGTGKISVAGVFHNIDVACPVCAITKRSSQDV